MKKCIHNISSRKLCDDDNCEYCFDRSFASHPKAKYWDYNKNKVNPRNIFKGTKNKYFFNCGTCGHLFYKNVNSIKISWCPYCANKKLCGNKNCKICFDKSFESHLKSKNWVIDKNKDKPIEILKRSSKYGLFKCNICNHIFKLIISSVTNKKHPQWCPYCANKKLCGNKDCIICFNKSFKSHPKSKFFDMRKNKINPIYIFKKSLIKYWFSCNKCNHSFKSGMDKITRHKSQWCPYCAKPCRKLCEDGNCNFCFSNSFASHPKSKYFDITKNEIIPRNIMRGTNKKKYWFTCNKCNKPFKMYINSVTNKNKSQWCPYCVNKTEKMLLEWLDKKYPEYTIEFQPKFKWCKNKETNRLFPYDFLIKELKLILEIDGNQHFKQVSNWQSPKTQQERDKFKMKCAYNNGYSMIRILQEDVYNNKNNWENKLINQIKKYTCPTIICNGPDYKCFAPFIKKLIKLSNYTIYHPKCKPK